VAHKAVLISALSRALAERITLMDLEIGRKGLLGYLKSLAGSNVVKVVPANGSASPSAEGQAADKRLKVICGSHTSSISDKAWVKEPSGKGKGKATPLTFAEVRICPSNTVKPNIGSLELAEALNRVLPFTAKDDQRPVLACVNIEAKEGKLTLVSADGFRLAVVTLDYDEGEGQVLIDAKSLRGIPNALRKAKRARVSFEAETVNKVASLILDTELIRYKWTNHSGTYPNWQNLIPTEFKTLAHFDTVEVIKAIRSLKALTDNKGYPIDLTIGNGKIVLADADKQGQAEVSADTEGEGFIRIFGSYLVDALRACGGMVDFKMQSPASPILLSTNGYRLVVMPMLTEKAKEYQAQKQVDKTLRAEGVAQGQGEVEVVAQAEAVAAQAEGQPEGEGKPDNEVTQEDEVTQQPKPKRKRRKEPIAIA
jgi:DNA polymerase-3 subunit beta